MIEELSGCHDNREVIGVSTSYVRKEFPGFSFYGILLPDSELHHWHFIAIANPDVKDGQGVSLSALPTDEPIDPIMKELGQDVSLPLSHDKEIIQIFNGDPEQFVLQPSPELETVKSTFGFEAKTMLAASWLRPRGGMGWIVLGYRGQERIDDHRLRLFATMVRVTSRMAIFPEMVHEVARTERIGMSLRRNIVHDLKTPITVIRGYAQTMLVPGVVDDPATQRELLNGIIEQSDRLLDDLKDILMPLDEAWRPQPEEFDLSLVLQQAIIAERHTERAQNHRIQLEGTDKKCEVYVDRRKIRRVLENLASNAVKYSPGSGKTVTIVLDADPEWVHVAFSDQGIGLNPDQIERVLDDGGRVADVSLGIEGAGFGIDSCQRVLEEHGGKLEVRSEPGLGSTFTAIFPRRLKI